MKSGHFVLFYVHVTPSDTPAQRLKRPCNGETHNGQIASQGVAFLLLRGFYLTKMICIWTHNRRFVQCKGVANE